MQFDTVVLIILVMAILGINIAMIWMQGKAPPPKISGLKKRIEAVDSKVDTLIDKLNEMIEALNTPPPGQYVPTEEDLQALKDKEGFMYGLAEEDRQLMAFIEKEALDLKLEKPTADEYAKSWSHLEEIGDRSRGYRESNTNGKQGNGRVDLAELEPTGPIHGGGVRGLQEPPSLDA